MTLSSAPSQLNIPQSTPILRKDNWWKLILFIALLGGLIAVCYRCVLFDFFAGDDFGLVIWLKTAQHNPELIWRQFYSPWLESNLTKFYRPMVTATLAAEYSLWQANGLGFRLVNLLFMLSTGILLGSIIKTVWSSSDNAKATKLSIERWAIAATTLFCLYPLHPEAVVWIIGRVDSLVTLFILLSLWCYIRFRRSASLLMLLGTCLSTAFALATKEMALVIPPLLFLYEFILCENRDTAASSSNFMVKHSFLEGVISQAKQSFIHTLPVWGVFGAYLVVRCISFGTLVGGYDNSLFLTENWQMFLYRLFHGLKMLVVPINKDLLGTHSLITKAWYLCLIVSTMLGLYTLKSAPKSRKFFVFLLLWFILSLLPVYKVFGINDDLKCSRYGYLASAPLCAMLTFGFSRISELKYLTVLSRTALAFFLIVSATLLSINNLAWREAGVTINSLQSNLRNFYGKVKGDPPVILIGLPDDIKGTYVFLNAIPGMTKSPLLSRDIYNCSSIADFEPIFPFGFLKDSIYTSKPQINAFFFDGSEQSLIPLNLGDNSTKEAWWQKRLSKNFCRTELGKHSRVLWTNNGCQINADESPNHRSAIILDFDSLPCWSTDFITFKLVLNTLPSQPLDVDLLYTNEIIKKFELVNRVHTSIKPILGEQEIIFPIHSIAQWSFGGRSRQLKLLLPAQCNLSINSVSSIEPKRIMPLLSFDHCDYFGTKGVISLNQVNPSCSLGFDASGIPNSCSVALEISRPSCFFETHNDSESSKLILRTIIVKNNRGKYGLNLSEFPVKGIYELRAKALDSKGKLLGVASDHIVISTETN